MLQCRKAEIADLRENTDGPTDWANESNSKLDASSKCDVTGNGPAAARLLA